MSFVTQLTTPCIMLALLIFGGQQGYVVYKDYKKITTKLAEPTERVDNARQDEKAFALFTPAIIPQVASAAVKKPLSAEVEGIIRSDDAWMSFAVVKTPGGQKSYREGETLEGLEDAYVSEINQDSVVVNYGGTPQVLALKKPDYFRGGVDSAPVMKSKQDAGADNLHLDDYLVLKPLIDNGQLEGYNINPRNASSFYRLNGLEKGDVVVKVDNVDMTNEAQAKRIIAGWSKMKAADVVIRRHAHLENIRVNILNN